MKDQRIPALRRALDALVESLDATLRVRKWVGPEEVPEPLKIAANKLVERLGAADRLASIEMRGNDEERKRAGAMTAAIKRLDVAYVAFRQAAERAPANIDEAVATLREEIDVVKDTTF